MVLGGVRDFDWFWTESSFVREVELWDPATGVWTIGNQLPTATAHSASVVLPDGRVWLAGGRTGVQGLIFPSDIWMITPYIMISTEK
jgi:hypothetical protein